MKLCKNNPNNQWEKLLSFDLKKFCQIIKIFLTVGYKGKGK